MNIQNAVFALFVCLGAGYLVYGQMGDGSTVQDLIMSGIGIVAGAGGLLYNNGASIKKLFSGTKNGRSRSRIYVPADYEQEDLKCLVHMRERMAEFNDSEGLELCSKLNTILFNLQQRAKKEDLKNVETK